MLRVALYIGLAAIGHFLWEAAQLPLYTLWRTGTPREIVSALFHCTGGDVLITTVTLAAAAALAWPFHWRAFGWRMVFTAILLGAAYTVFSEWLNVDIRRSWSYTAAMPVLPLLAPVSRRCCSGLPSQAWPSPLLCAGGGASKGGEGRLHLQTTLCYPEFLKVQTQESRAHLVKRSRLLRCLIVLLSLALASGNAHAALHLDAAHGQPCPEEHAHHGGKTSPHNQHQRDNGLACCCDCLGCSSAVYLPPDSGIKPAELTAQLHYDARTASLSGRELRPDPDPPRPGPLS